MSESYNLNAMTELYNIVSKVSIVLNTLLDMNPNRCQRLH